MAHAGVPQCSILVPNFFVYGFLTFQMMLLVTLPSMLIMLLSTPNYDQASYLWQQLKLLSELESDQQDLGLAQEVP